MTSERERCLTILARHIIQIERAHPVRVAVDGPDAAGKTTLADELAPLIERSGRPVVRASIDGFHRPRSDRYARGPYSPEGYYFDSFDYPALRANLLEPLGPGGDGAFRRRVFDFGRDEPVAGQADGAQPEWAGPGSILVFDGVFLLRRELVDQWDFSIFVAVPFAETRRRAAERDIELFGSFEETDRRYEMRYVPGQRLYYSRERPQSKADVVLDNTDPNGPRLIWP
jgi:uridine kinase